MTQISRRALMAHAAALTSLAACSSDPATHQSELPSDVLGDLDATGIAAHIRARDFTASEALEAAIVRAEAVNPQLNFFATKAYEYGRTRAAQASSGPFAGVPTLIKDLLPLAGIAMKQGSRAFATYIPDAQPPYTDALLAAGLVPFGKSTTPEFGLTCTTEPVLTGATRNPWDVSRSGGGSSGGAGAAVAARVVPIAHASDGGGSIRIPASCNGLVGLKYSRDRDLMPGGPPGGISLGVEGCLSRTVRDTAAWLALTEKKGANASYPPVGLVTGPSQRRLRIAVQITDTRGLEPDADVRAATEAAAELCRSLGHEVRERRMDVDGAAFADAFTLLWAAGAAEVVQQVSEAAPNTPIDQLLEPLTLELARLYQRNPEALRPALARLRGLGPIYETFFQDSDVLLTPVLASTPPEIGYLSPTLGLEGFQRVMRYVGYTPLQNVSGGPAISLPLSESATGLPIGAHFSAAKGQERTLLELAYELELAQPWAGRKPGVVAA